MNRPERGARMTANAVAVTAIALVLCQCGGPAEAPLPLPAGAVLVVRAADLAITRQLARALGTARTRGLANDATTPQVITVGEDRSVTIADAPADRCWLSATADPAALMTAFATEVERLEPMARGALTMAFQQFGATAKDAAAAADSILTFPQQVHQVTLRIRGSPLDRNSRGMTIVVGLEPTAGSAFARALAGLRPNDAGAPVLPGAARAAVAFQVSLAPDAMPSWAAASALLTPCPAELRATVASVYERMAQCFDGTMAATFGPDGPGGPGVVATGLRDAAGMASLMASDDYRRVMSTPSTVGGHRPDIDFTPQAFVHRGATFTRTKASMDESNPLVRSGTLVTTCGIAGDWLIDTFNGDDAATKAIADTAHDGGLKRARLGDGVVLRLSADLQSVLAAISPGRELPAVPGMPQGLDLTVTSKGSALQLEIRLD